MADNPLVSVIIPVYKVESYLRECVDSVINQTYKNLEIILVDDGSPDNCPKICDEYALQDSRVKVIHKDNGGLSDARNAGMNIATGNYWSFVDSDDVCHKQMIELLMNPIMEKKVDISCCNELFFYDKSELSRVKDNIVSSYEIFETKKWFLKRYSDVAWNKIYNKQLFDNIKYPVGRYHEDLFTTYKVCYNASLIACTTANLYFYRQRRGSIMTSPSKKRSVDFYEATFKRLFFFQECDIDLYSKFLILAAIYYCEMQNITSLMFTNDYEIIQKWKSELKGKPIEKINIQCKIRYIFLLNFPCFRNFLKNIIKGIVSRNTLDKTKRFFENYSLIFL